MSMKSSHPIRLLLTGSHLWQYLAAFLLIAIITAIFFVLRDVLETTLVALLYLIPLGLITAFLGLGPGITSALLCFLTFNYFFIQPYYTFAVHRPTDVVILIVFLTVAVVISQLVGRMQTGLAAATAREREATRLYELSTALTGLQDDRAIAQILAKQVMAVSQGEYVEINIAGTEPFTISIPATGRPSQPPIFEVPIQAARGLLGEIRLWRAAPAIPSAEKRLLQIRQSGRAGARTQLAGAGRVARQSPGGKRPAEIGHPVLRFARTAHAALHHQGGRFQPARQRGGLGFTCAARAGRGHRR